MLASAATVLLGSAALAGWLLGIPALAEWAPGFGAIKADTALAFLFAGSGLAALRVRRHRWVWVCGAAVAALGLADLLRYTTSREWLEAASLPLQPGALLWLGARGQMAPASALAFLFVAGTLLSFSGAVPRRHKSHVVLILACSIIGVAALGRLEGLSSLIAGIAPVDFSGMAAGTALGLAVLAAGLFSIAFDPRSLFARARARSGGAAAGKNEERSIQRLIVLQTVATGMLVALLGILAISQVQIRKADAAARHGLESLARLQRADIELDYGSSEPGTALAAGPQAERLQSEIAAAAAACRLVTGEPGGAAVGDGGAGSESRPAGLRAGCASLPGSGAGQPAGASRFETLDGMRALRALEDGLKQGVNRLVQVSLDELPKLRAREASARQWQTSVLVACLLAGLGASVLQLGLLQRLRHQHAALAAETAKRNEAEARCEASLEVAPAAILGVDRAGRITLANSRALCEFGYGSAELLGQPLSLLVSERQRAAHDAGFTSYMREPGTRALGFDSELTARRKDGGEFPAEVHVTPIEGASGQMVLAAVTNISQHKKAQDELRRAVRELEAFAHSVSHDLRRPLQIMLGFSELLEATHAETLSTEGREILQRIIGAGVHMGELIEDLLSLAKVSTGEVCRTPVSLGAVAETVLDGLRAAEPGRAVTLTLQGGLEAEGDPHLVRIQLENLLGNAWKFTGKTAAPEIELGCLRQRGARVFYVKDNGAGFDMEKAGQLFKAFHRLHDASDFPGTGIGLATVQRIVHRHGGIVWAQSEPERGATFYFTLQTGSDPQIPATEEEESGEPVFLSAAPA
jgi:PAS domain S-box-containing protein